MRIFILALSMLLLATFSQAMTVTPWENVTEVDGNFTVFYSDVSGSPVVLISVLGPGMTDSVPICVLNPVSNSCSYTGPAEYMRAQLIGAGSADISWCGRVAP